MELMSTESAVGNSNNKRFFNLSWYLNLDGAMVITRAQILMMSSFSSCEINDAIQYINLGYGAQAPKIVIL